MRHRHIPWTTALLPCVAVLLVTPLTTAADGPGARLDAPPCRVARAQPSPATGSLGGVEAITDDANGARPADLPRNVMRHHWANGPHSDPSSPPRGSYERNGGVETGSTAKSTVGDDDGTFGTQNLYEPDPPEQQDSGARSGSVRTPTTAATGEVSPVLPLGAGLTFIGLGLAFLALRLRRG